jgi:hypothetical protein
MSVYQRMIAEVAAKSGRVDVNPRWVEGWMRIEHGCLDGLSRQKFRSEVLTGIACCDASTEAENESLAHSFGL